MRDRQRSPRSEILNRAAAIIENGWVQGASAKTPHGTPCAANDPHACCWCLTGAIARAVWEQDPGADVHNYSTDTTPEVWAVAQQMLPFDPRQESGFNRLIHWNDAPERTAEEVIRLLQSTAATLRA